MIRYLLALAALPVSLAIGARILSSGPYFGTARQGWRAADQTPEEIRR